MLSPRVVAIQRLCLGVLGQTLVQRHGGHAHTSVHARVAARHRLLGQRRGGNEGGDASRDR